MPEFDDLEYDEKVEAVNDALTKVLEDYVNKRNTYQELADVRYAEGHLDASTQYNHEYREYMEAKKLLVDIMFDGKSLNDAFECLQDYELL